MVTQRGSTVAVAVALLASLASACGKRDDSVERSATPKSYAERSTAERLKAEKPRSLAATFDPLAADIGALRTEMEKLDLAHSTSAAVAVADHLVAALRAQKRTTDADWPATLETYGRLLFASGRWKDAEPSLTEALTTPAGKTDPALRASLLFQLGKLYGEQRRNDEAIPILEESLALSEKAHGADASETSNNVEALAGVYDYVGRYAEAELLFRRSLVLAEKQHGAKSPQVGRVLTNLALNLGFQKRNDDALAMYERAIPLLADTVGYDRSALAEANGGIGGIQRERKKSAIAEIAYRKALSVRIEAVGADHPAVAMDHHNLALVLKDQNKLPDALAHCARSEAIRQTVLAPDHPYRVGTEQMCARLRATLARSPQK